MITPKGKIDTQTFTSFSLSLVSDLEKMGYEIIAITYIGV